MDDFIPKPIEVKSLYKVLGKYLSTTEKQTDDLHETSKTTENEAIHFDKLMLMERVGNQQEMYEKLVKLTLKQFPLYIESLEQSSRTGDKEELKSFTHSIKGASLNMCFYRLTELALELEDSIHRGSNRTNALVSRVVQEWKKIETILR